MTSFTVGSLVRARGREWVVLPETDDALVMVRPLGGTDAEVTGILRNLEPVEPATFALPDVTQPGDYRSARLLRDALRLGFRSSAGPFRSFGHLAVEPRPYQLVPLLMALKLDPVRLLIADDVGVGKTVESALVAREVLDQGDARRLTVLCPPHLAEQWQSELASKFHLDCELVLASTAARLERGLKVGQSLFEVYPYTIVSTDFIKSPRRRDEFVHSCPELVIVDEAHTCAADTSTRSVRQQRYELVRDLALDAERHLILVTATPHSGKEDVFRSLLGLLDPAFDDLPDDLSGPRNEAQRRKLAQHFVQRKRGDMVRYLGADTSFPERHEAEQEYRLSSEYRKLFDRVLAYARESVQEPGLTAHRQRVRWWSALALLQALASSPAAAAATLRSRSKTADTDTPEEADEVGRSMVLDLGADENIEATDTVAGADDTEGDPNESAPKRANRRLLDLAREADVLRGAADQKLLDAAKLITKLLKDGFRPIVFCRFVDTAEYLAEELRGRLPKGTEVVAVTGRLPGDERQARIADLVDDHDRRVLVATDCLSEGINLQDNFDAVFHYDLSWNPTRHEQREGRVDRFGQLAPAVRVVTFFGVDNQIDGIVLDVLLRKYRKIRNSLGIAVPVPTSSNSVIDAVLEGLLLREGQGPAGEGGLQRLPGFDDIIQPRRKELELEWDAAADREKKSRTMFAQDSIHPDEVAIELQAVRDAVGVGADVERFVRDVVQAVDGGVSGEKPPFTIRLGDTPQGLRDTAAAQADFDARFEPPEGDSDVLLTRTHPFVEGLATWTLDAALDAAARSPARRCGVIRTDAVSTRTTLLLVRHRFHLVTTRAGVEEPLVAEDCGLLAFAGDPANPMWLERGAAEALLDAVPTANTAPEAATGFLSEVITASAAWQPKLDADAAEHAQQLEEAHRRVRDAAGAKGVRYRVTPQLPVDVLGIYVYLPAPKATSAASS
jgi:superfamily II DNA or RNA helicase